MEALFAATLVGQALEAMDATESPQRAAKLGGVEAELAEPRVETKEVAAAVEQVEVVERGAKVMCRGCPVRSGSEWAVGRWLEARRGPRGRETDVR